MLWDTDLDVDITPMPSDCDQEWLCVDEANSFVYHRANGGNAIPLPSDCEWLDDSDQQWCWYEENVAYQELKPRNLSRKQHRSIKVIDGWKKGNYG